MQDETERKWTYMVTGMLLLVRKCLKYKKEQYMDGKATYVALKDSKVPFDVYISIDWGYKPSTTQLYGMLYLKMVE